MTTILLQLALILVLARLAGWAFGRMGLPEVVGEIAAGILLGPSILGVEFSERLFPTDDRVFLVLLANVGLVLFMFVVGLELDMSLVKGRGRVAGAVSVTSIVLPFCLGLGLAAFLYTDHADGKPFWPFAMFIGASMSVTAFPVLARILTDRRMHRTETGGLALACAATDDVLAWTLLAVVIGLSGGTEGASWLVALAIPFVVVALVVVRPQLNRLSVAYEKAGRLTPGILAPVLVGLLVFAAVTEFLHVHFIFGAFLFGAIMPQRGAAALRHDILIRLEQISVLLLLPVFFLVSGLNVNLRGLSSENLVQLLAILAVAIGGKFLGAYAGARASGVAPWQARALGVLMNTRGLTELIILNVGRELELIGDDLFTMLVVMAVVTTVMTGPLLDRVYPRKQVQRDIAEAERQALGDKAVDRLLVVDEEGLDTGAAVDAAVALAVAGRPAEVVVVSLTATSVRRLEVGSGLTDELVEITAGMERLERLAARGREHGIPVRVISRPAADPAADLRELAEVIGPQLVVVALGSELAAELIREVDRPVVALAPYAPPLATAEAVAVGWRSGADGDAALLVATRLAAGLGVGLQVTGAGSARRLSGLRKTLGERDVPLVEGADDTATFRVGTADDVNVHATVTGETDSVPVDWRVADLGSRRPAPVQGSPD